MPAVPLNQRIARHLLRGSFGISSAQEVADAAGLLGPTAAFEDKAAEWLRRQIALPIRSHRAYFRERANARHSQALAAGGVRGPCELQSRWLDLAFTLADAQHWLTLVNGSLFVDGHLRARAPAGFAVPAGAGEQPWFICSVAEAELGSVSIGSACSYSFSNTKIAFAAGAEPEAARVVHRAATFLPVAPPASGAFVLAASPSLASCSPPGFGPLFAATPTGWLLFDPRLRFLHNSPDAPVNATAEVYPGCPAVRQPFLNPQFCQPAQSACHKRRYAPTPFRFNASTARAFYELGGLYIHYISGLRTDLSLPPCSDAAVTRWKRTTDCADADTPGTARLDAATLAFLQSTIRAADDGAAVLDVGTRQASCTVAAAGVKVNVSRASDNSSECWVHSHPDEFSLRDFTYWTRRHTGNPSARSGSRPNPIAHFADTLNSAEFVYPAHHTTQRWSDTRANVPLAAPRLGAVVDFALLPARLQLPVIAEVLGARPVPAQDDGFEACGSPFEVANVPSAGNLYLAGTVGLDDTKLQEPDQYQSGPDTIFSKTRVWANAVLTAPDQLRQRVAWALAQLFVIGEDGLALPHMTEPYHAFTDLFLRHAFGNFRDILREVTFSPMMARMLTYDGSRSLEFWLRLGQELYPDENYAREVMQLFTNGLWRLHDNGTLVVDQATGDPIPTYTTEDIFDLARVWTGFQNQPARSNLDMGDGISTPNFVDPTSILVNLHDFFPKRGMDGRYIGDRYPLCEELPPRAFLRKGAVFRYVGTTPAPGMHAQLDPETFTTPHSLWLELSAASSPLHAALCDRDPATDACRLKSRVQLPVSLACHALECNVDTVRIVRVDRSAHQAPVYYEYLRQPCVRMMFAERGFAVVDRAMSRAACADERLAVAAETCCAADSGPSASAPGLFDEERVTRATGARRCTARGLQLCRPTTVGAQYSYQVDLWTSEPCRMRAQVTPDGRVNAAHTFASTDLQAKVDSRVGLDTLFGSRVNWVGGKVPLVTASGLSPSPNCTVRGGTALLCDAVVHTSTVFGSMPQTRQAILHRLHIGAHDPEAASSLSRCVTAECTALAGVEVFTNNSAGKINAAAVFRVAVAGRTYRLSNRQSVVHVGAGFAFRNPPAFSYVRELTPRDAHYEVLATLDSYLEQPSVAPFLADFFIKRFVTSNPSPGYVERVASAFRVGAHAGFGTGTYGDLAATVAAILLDREALSSAVEADPMHGRLQEPLIKLFSMMRGLRYTPRDGMDVDLQDLDDELGQMAHKSPTVFNFYQSDYQSPGVVAATRLVAPEAQIINTPTVISWLNGILSLVEYGLTDCDRGFGRRPALTRNCNRIRWGTQDPATVWAGSLRWSATDAGAATTPDGVIDAMALVLTGGRLSAHSRAVIAAGYAESEAAGGAAKAVRTAIELFCAAPELSTTVLHAPLNTTFEPAEAPTATEPESPGNTSDYKAIVYVYLSGGADSYNLLIPHSSCTAMAAQYRAVRGAVALNPDAQIATDVPPGTQPCDRFATHASLGRFKQLYDAGDAAFVANIGPLVEPVAKDRFLQGTAVVPPGIGAHNVQTKATQSVHAQATGPLGVLGRVRDALQADGVASAAYSISGNTFVLKGESSALPGDIVDRRQGATPFDEYSMFPHLRRHIDALVRNGSTSILGHTWAESVSTALSRSEQLVDSLTAEGTLKQTFAALSADSSGFSDQLYQAARIIAARKALGSQRDAFFVSIGSFDTHADAFGTLQTKMGQFDVALHSFAEEMKLQGVWDGVTVVTASEFGRTITSNGAGTDHGWGGITMIAGGGINGSRVFGKYPYDISDDSSLNVGRGRLIPTLSWEALWSGVASWFGVSQHRLHQVLPNLANFPESSLLNVSDLYK